jgi:putative tricarboxylic transport membrane protein
MRSERRIALTFGVSTTVTRRPRTLRPLACTAACFMLAIRSSANRATVSSFLLLYAIFTAMLLANLIFLVCGLLGAKLFARITLIPTPILWPAVFVLACIGSYALEQSMLDVWVMIVAALLGSVLKRCGFSAAPIIMGLVLGAMVENTLKQSLIIFDHNWLRFLERPIVLVFLALTLISVVMPVISSRRAKNRLRKLEQSA